MCNKKMPENKKNSIFLNFLKQTKQRFITLDDIRDVNMDYFCSDNNSEGKNNANIAHHH